MPAESIYICKQCGGRGGPTGNKDGYPALKCVKCDLTWWYTDCWNDHHHDIDERTAKVCKKCGWRICPECGACKPEDQCQTGTRRIVRLERLRDLKQKRAFA